MPHMKPCQAAEKAAEKAAKVVGPTRVSSRRKARVDPSFELDKLESTC